MTASQDIFTLYALSYIKKLIHTRNASQDTMKHSMHTICVYTIHILDCIPSVYLKVDIYKIEIRLEMHYTIVLWIKNGDHIIIYMHIVTKIIDILSRCAVL